MHVMSIFLFGIDVAVLIGKLYLSLKISVSVLYDSKFFEHDHYPLRKGGRLKKDF